MKVGIVTFVDYNNYGNRLQNYAMQEFLREKGFQTETIMMEPYQDYHYTDAYIKKLPVHWAKTLVKAVYAAIMPRQKSFIQNLLDDSLVRRRKNANIIFTNDYITETEYVVREGQPHKKQLNTYDFLAAGSDQIWNPTMTAATDYFFLRSVPKEKRIAIAASVGLAEIPKNRQKQWATYMKGMKYISVREKSAQKLVKDLAGRDAVVLLDPTMLVKRSVWDDLAASRKFPYAGRKYIVTYILGGFGRAEERYLREAARVWNMEIIWLNDKRYKKEFVLDAVDFVQIIAHAGMVVTDSYHACIFSILYHRQFYVFQRQGRYSDIYSRIQDLLDRFGLQEHAVRSMEELYQRACARGRLREAGMQEAEIKRVEKRLEAERNKADRYIRRTMMREKQ